MKYKIIARIKDGRATTGFKLLSTNRKVIIASKEQVISLAKNKSIVNAVYNETTNSISGINGTDLRRLPIFQNNETNTDIKIGKYTKNRSRHELARLYESKASLLGLCNMQFKYLKDDRVQLVDVIDSTDKLIIPSFITDIKLRKYGKHRLSPLSYGNFSEIIIDAPLQDMQYLCSCLRSKHLKIVYRNKAKVFDLSFMFLECIWLESLDICIDTSDVLSTQGMFYDCYSLKELDLSRLNTSNVTQMQEMFRGCGSLKELNLSSFDTSKVYTMQEMFSNCSELEELNLSSFDTSRVTHMQGLFENCGRLKSIDLSNFNTSHTFYMESMFSGCAMLKRLDLSSFNTSNVITMKQMFTFCLRLEEINLRSFDTSKVREMNCMFYHCESLKRLDLSNFDTSKVREMDGMFYHCQSLQKLDLSSFNTDNVLNMRNMFYYCKSLKNLDISHFSVPYVDLESTMLEKCDYIETFILPKS